MRVGVGEVHAVDDGGGAGGDQGASQVDAFVSSARDEIARKGKAADITLALWDEARAVMKKQAARWAP